MARRTTNWRLKEGLEIYNPVDNHGKYLQNVEFFGGQFVFAANQSVIDKLIEVEALLQTSQDQPLLSALLALQEADHLPRHRAVVHQHEGQRSARQGTEGDRPGAVDTEMGA